MNRTILLIGNNAFSDRYVVFLCFREKIQDS